MTIGFAVQHVTTGALISSLFIELSSRVTDVCFLLIGFKVAQTSTLTQRHTSFKESSIVTRAWEGTLW